jgi:hypothetical protein
MVCCYRVTRLLESANVLAEFRIVIGCWCGNRLDRAPLRIAGWWDCQLHEFQFVTVLHHFVTVLVGSTCLFFQGKG